MSRKYIRGTTKERIEYYTDRSGGPDACWPWLGAKDKDGYPYISTGPSRCSRALKVIYQAYVGPVPPGKEIRHTCDHPWCGNYGHMIPGTHMENVQDCVSRQRQGRGSQKQTAKLHESDIPTIRMRVRSGETQTSVARHYGVSQVVISNIMRGKSWRHVP
jgi:hypothetical protein